MTVRGTGRGIEPDALPLLFDRFRQIAPQASGQVGGIGQGLLGREAYRWVAQRHDHGFQ